MWPIFTKTLYHSRKLILWLAVGFGLYGAFVGALYPFMIENAEQYNQIMESSPEFLAFLTGMDVEEVQSYDMGNLGNFLHMEMMLWLMMIAGSVAIYQAFSAFTNAERDHSMDMLLSLPLSRRDNLLGQFGVTVVTALVALFAGFLGVVVSAPTWGEEIEWSLSATFLGVMFAFWPVIVIAALAFLLVALSPSSRRYAGAVAYVFWIGSYMVAGVVGAIKSLNSLKPLFIYNYYNTGEIMEKGIIWSDLAILLLAAAVLLAAAWWKIEDKELGV